MSQTFYETQESSNTLMEDFLASLPDWAITTAIGVLGFVVFWLNRQRLGLGEVQTAARAERDAVVVLQERRIVLLEAEVARLKTTISYLQADNDELRRRIRAMEPQDDS